MSKVILCEVDGGSCMREMLRSTEDRSYVNENASFPGIGTRERLRIG